MFTIYTRVTSKCVNNTDLAYLGGVGPHKTTKQFLNIDPWLNGLKFSWPLFAE